jgi:hypothetical protein
MLPLAAGMTCLCLVSSIVPRTQDDGSRQIVLEEFTKARPTSTSPGPRRTSGPRRKPTASASAKVPKYIRKTPSFEASLQPNTPSMEIGVTIWRLRPGVTSDGGARVLVMENAQSSQWTPQRIEADTPLRVGERVRITIESPRAREDRQHQADDADDEPTEERIPEAADVEAQVEET